MEPWEDELLWDDDFSDEEEDTEEQIEEADLEMDEDSFADWKDSSDGALVDETLEEALQRNARWSWKASWSRTSIPETMPPSWRTRRKKPRLPVRSDLSGKFAQRLCGGWRKQPGRNRIF